MARIVVQQGHVPRKTGATGAPREQEFVRLVGPQLTKRLIELGHTVFLIGADDPVPPSDVFLSLHTDGAANPERRGASIGYPDDRGRQLAQAWQRAHRRHGYPANWMPDNYTTGLSSYYGYKRSSARYRFLAEHGTTTNRLDADWLFSHVRECVEAHVDAIGEVLGHPAQQQEVDLASVPQNEWEQVRDRVGALIYALFPEGDLNSQGEPVKRIRDLVGITLDTRARVEALEARLFPPDPQPEPTPKEQA